MVCHQRIRWESIEHERKTKMLSIFNLKTCKNYYQEAMQSRKWNKHWSPAVLNWPVSPDWSGSHANLATGLLDKDFENHVMYLCNYFQIAFTVKEYNETFLNLTIFAL
jgi:hypothetical protein